MEVDKAWQEGISKQLEKLVSIYSCTSEVLGIRIDNLIVGFRNSNIELHERIDAVETENTRLQNRLALLEK